MSEQEKRSFRSAFGHSRDFDSAPKRVFPLVQLRSDGNEPLESLPGPAGKLQRRFDSLRWELSPRQRRTRIASLESGRIQILGRLPPLQRP